MRNLELFFTFEKETKNTYRYKETNPETGEHLTPEDGPAIGTLYLRQKAVGGSPPAAVRVFVEGKKGD